MQTPRAPARRHARRQPESRNKKYLARLLKGVVGVVLLGVEAAILDDEIEGKVHQAAVAAVVLQVHAQHFHNAAGFLGFCYFDMLISIYVASSIVST